MKNLFSAILAALEKQETVQLCTVIESEGSAPRGKGAKMAVFADGTVLGTVGGGSVEAMAIQNASALLSEGSSEIHSYDLGVGGDTGMICGGRVRIAFCLLTNQDTDTLRQIVASYDRQENAWLRIDLTTMRCSFVAHPAEDLKHIPVLSATTYSEPLVHRETVYLFGCGHVSLEVAPLLAHVGFRVIVMDNRDYLATAERFPDAFRVICGDFDRIYDYVTITEDDYVVIMTPGHQADYQVLRQALQSDAAYVGCIGSRMKIAKTKERLLEDQIPQTTIDRMTAPIGLSIGSETPAEIAVSVAAQLIQHRAERRKAAK